MAAFAERSTPATVRTDGFRWGLSRRAVRLILDYFFAFKIEVEGLEHVPPGEPLLIATAPHRNWLDPFLVIVCLPRTPRTCFLGSREAVLNSWWKRLVIGAFGGLIPVSSVGALNREALETALAVLRSGASLGIFPEGWGVTDDPPDRLSEIKRGAAWIALRSGRRILPVAVAGTKDLWRGKTLRVRVGPPVAPTDSEGRARDREATLTRDLEQALSRQLPPLPPYLEPELRPWPWLTNLLD